MNNPDLYEKNNFMQKRDVKTYMKKQVQRLNWKRSNIRVMDVGCGGGGVTKILETFLPTDFTLLGCDKNENMVTFAANHNSNVHTSFIVLDISEEIPEEMMGNFDQIFSFYTLHWVIDQKRGFENIFNLLEEDGECSIILVANAAVFDVYRALANSKWSTWVFDVEKYISPYHDSKEPEKELTKLMTSIGFVDVEVECKDIVYLFDDKDARRNLMSALNPFMVPNDKYDDFMKDYFQVMDDIENGHKVNTNYASTDSTFHYKSLEIYARKPLSCKELDANVM